MYIFCDILDCVCLCVCVSVCEVTNCLANLRRQIRLQCKEIDGKNFEAKKLFAELL